MSAETAFWKVTQPGGEGESIRTKDPIAAAEPSKLLLILPSLSSLLKGACGCLLDTTVDSMRWTLGPL